MTGIVAMVLFLRVSEATASATETRTKELRGSVLDVLRALLVGRHDDEVIALVTQLVARNHELEVLLGKLRESRNRGEHISTDQLNLFLDKLTTLSSGALADANEKLDEAAKKNGGRPETPKPPKQPPVRRPVPPGLRRVDNPSGCLRASGRVRPAARSARASRTRRPR